MTEGTDELVGVSDDDEDDDEDLELADLEEAPDVDQIDVDPHIEGDRDPEP